MQRFLFLGASITDAYRSYEDDQLLGMGYVVMTAGKMANEFLGRFDIYNRGISGDRSIDLYARLHRDAINLQPDYLSILIGGGNDVWRELTDHDGVSPEHYKHTLSKIILELQQFSPAIKIILLESFVLHGKLTNPYFKELSESVYRYAGIVYDLSRSFALPFVPLQNKLTSLAKRLQMHMSQLTDFTQLTLDMNSFPQNSSRC